jgi:hypothetical protein
MHFLVIFNKILQNNKIALTTFWEKKFMNYTGIFDLIWLKYLFQKILRKKLSSKVLF